MGQAHQKSAPERRCIVTGDSGPTLPMVRFVLGPDNAVVPDVDEKLPGRGAWVTADAEVFANLERKPPFARAFKSSVNVPQGLTELVVTLLSRRCLSTLGLARGAGQVVTGYEKVRETSDKGPVGAMIVADDSGGTAQSRAKKMAWEAPLITHFGRDELSLALGRENVVHAAVAPGRLADLFVRDAKRHGLMLGLPDYLKSEKRN